MKMPSLAAFLAGSMLALATHAALAQDAKKPDPATDKPAAGAAQDPAAKPAPGPGQPPDPQIIESMMTCLAEGLTQDWQKAWFVIKEIDRNEAEGTRQFEGDFFYATNVKDRKGMRLRTCGPEHVIKGVSDLNDYLTKEQQRWTSAVFTFTRADGKYDVKYDYTPFKPKPAAAAPAEKPATKSTAKKKQETAK
jgi:hypothetical protein